MFAASIAVVVSLREVLLPFVAGMALAYLLDPLAQRLERLGTNRLLATLAIVALFIVIAVGTAILLAPVIVDELAHFIEKLPVCVRQLRGLATDPNRPWLSRIIGEGLGHAEQSVGELTTLASSWFDTFLHSVWSGGQALISVFSLLVVTPIVAFYLIYDWNRMIAAIDNLVPLTRRAHRAGSRSRDRRYDWRIRARTKCALPYPRVVLFGGALVASLQHAQSSPVSADDAQGRRRSPRRLARWRLLHPAWHRREPGCGRSLLSTGPRNSTISMWRAPLC